MVLKDDVEWQRTKELEELKQKNKLEIINLTHNNRIRLLEEVKKIADKNKNFIINIGEI